MLNDLNILLEFRLSNLAMIRKVINMKLSFNILHIDIDIACLNVSKMFIYDDMYVTCLSYFIVG